MLQNKGVAGDDEVEVKNQVASFSLVAEARGGTSRFTGNRKAGELTPFPLIEDDNNEIK